ncbi:MAG: transposase [Deltaproteobacteria bacterium]|nr:transposase [Deltaproteobacteria bacterium]
MLRCSFGGRSRSIPLQLASFGKRARTIRKHRGASSPRAKGGLDNGRVEGFDGKARVVTRRAFGSPLRHEPDRDTLPCVAVESTDVLSKRGESPQSPGHSNAATSVQSVYQLPVWAQDHEGLSRQSWKNAGSRSVH